MIPKPKQTRKHKKCTEYLLKYLAEAGFGRVRHEGNEVYWCRRVDGGLIKADYGDLCGYIFDHLEKLSHRRMIKRDWLFVCGPVLLSDLPFIAYEKEVSDGR